MARKYPPTILPLWDFRKRPSLRHGENVARIHFFVTIVNGAAATATVTVPAVVAADAAVEVGRSSR